MRRVPGFTLVELLIVMAILAMLAALVGPELFGSLGRGQRAAAATQMAQLAAALDSYRLDVGGYPRTLEGLVVNESGRSAWSGPYLRRGLPRDPWDNDYQYQLNGREFTLLSYGADCVPGGEGDNADISH